MSVSLSIFFVNDTAAPGKSSDLQSLLIFSPLLLHVHLNFDYSYRRWCILLQPFMFGSSHTNFRRCFVLLFVSVQSFERFIFNCTIISNTVIFASIPLFSIVQTRKILCFILCSFINMFYCTFECILPYAMVSTHGKIHNGRNIVPGWQTVGGSESEETVAIS